MSLFTQPSNQWRRGGTNCCLHWPIILLVQQLNNNREVNIAGYCIFIFSNIRQNTSNTLLPLIFHIIATKASQLEKCCATKAFLAPPAGRFKKSAWHSFSWLKTLWWTHIIEYLLLDVWPISLFCIYAIYWSQTWESRQEYGHEICVAVIHRRGFC